MIGLLLALVLVAPRPAPPTPALAAQIAHAAHRYGIPRQVAFGLVRTESRFNPWARGSHGEVGLTQILPSTGRRVCGLRVDELWDPARNLDCGFKLFASLRRRYGSDWLAMVGYNQGPRVADSIREQGNGYPEKVLAVRYH